MLERITEGDLKGRADALNSYLISLGSIDANIYRSYVSKRDDTLEFDTAEVRRKYARDCAVSYSDYKNRLGLFKGLVLRGFCKYAGKDPKDMFLNEEQKSFLDIFGIDVYQRPSMPKVRKSADTRLFERVVRLGELYDSGWKIYKSLHFKMTEVEDEYLKLEKEARSVRVELDNVDEILTNADNSVGWLELVLNSKKSFKDANEKKAWLKSVYNDSRWLFPKWRADKWLSLPEFSITDWGCDMIECLERFKKYDLPTYKNKHVNLMERYKMLTRRLGVVLGYANRLVEAVSEDKLQALARVKNFFEEVSMVKDASPEVSNKILEKMQSIVSETSALEQQIQDAGSIELDKRVSV